MKTNPKIMWNAAIMEGMLLINYENQWGWDSR
jgi:hypothetical protein